MQTSQEDEAELKYQENWREPSIESDSDTYVQIENLKKYYKVEGGLIRNRADSYIRAVDDVSFSIPKGDTFGLVGESGSGKTTCAKTILRLEEPTEGTINIGGKDITKFNKKEMRKFRRNAQIVYQDPTSCLNPRKKVEKIIREPLEIHDVGSYTEKTNRVDELVDLVGIPPDHKYKYPGALSGGQKQRVGIARAIALNPEFLVLDEPTSALDVSVQARIISLLKKIQNEFDLTYLFISHNLSLINNISDWVGVMYLGRLVEIGPVNKIFHNPTHPYTRSLINAIPTIYDEDEKIKPPEIFAKGEVPDPRNKPSGCAFRSRCSKEFAECSKFEPPFYKVGTNHYSRCFLYDDEYKPSGPDW